MSALPKWRRPGGTGRQVKQYNKRTHSLPNRTRVPQVNRPRVVLRCLDTYPEVGDCAPNRHIWPRCTRREREPLLAEECGCTA